MEWLDLTLLNLVSHIALQLSFSSRQFCHYKPRASTDNNDLDLVPDPVSDSEDEPEPRHCLHEYQPTLDTIENEQQDRPYKPDEYTIRRSSCVNDSPLNNMTFNTATPLRHIFDYPIK